MKWKTLNGLSKGHLNSKYVHKYNYNFSAGNYKLCRYAHWNSQLKPHSLQSELIDAINHNGRYVPNLENIDKNTWISTRVCKSKMRIKINQDANFSKTMDLNGEDTILSVCFQDSNKLQAKKNFSRQKWRKAE